MITIGLLLGLTAIASGPEREPEREPGSEPIVNLLDEAAVEEESQDVWEAIANGRTWLNFRYRMEGVEQDGKAENAYASTLRTTLGYETGVFRGFSAFLEFEDVAGIGAHNFNDTINGKGDHPVVADPDGSELNQAYLTYSGSSEGKVRLGRQEIVLGNHRFVGNVGWRQNHQSFDALRVTSNNDWPVEFDYAAVTNVNRIFGDGNPMGDERGAMHFLNVGHDWENVGELTGYAYLLDFDTNLSAMSTNTFGVSFAGATDVADGTNVSYRAEFATQSDAPSNGADIDAGYYHAMVGVKNSGVQVLLGNESLGGSGDAGDKFSTPLATLHRHNGFADMFLNTPDTGLDDLYFTVSGAVEVGSLPEEVKLRATYHMFESDSDSIDYGTEIDFDASVAVNSHITTGIRFADFSADDAFSDTRKVMFWLSLSPL
ncbi:MAG: hypothetical protein ACI82F_004629 [Planctomycetota bacterium]|jgi:hypothetical protein